MAKKNKTQRVDAEPVPPEGEVGTALLAPASALTLPMSLKGGVSLLPVPVQEVALAEYDKRRNFFAKWLDDHLKEGVHYGIPPGCERRKKVDPKQWVDKKSLYKAGALLVVDLLRLKAVYEADKDAWVQMGSKPGTFVMKCELVNPANGGDVIGEGRGVFAVGEKSMIPNSALKMCEKRALVDAVLHAVPIMGERYTQDIEDLGPNPQPQPEQDPMQPKAPTRSERTPPANGNNKENTIFKTAAYATLVTTYRGKFPGSDKKAFLQWATDVVGSSMTADADWTIERVQQCRGVLQ